MADNLKWKKITEGFEDFEDGFDDGIFYGIEELDDATVVKSGSNVKIVPQSEVEEKPAVKPAVKQTATPKKTSSKKSKKRLNEDHEKIADDNAFKALSKPTVKDIEPCYKLGTWPENLDWRIYTGLKLLEFNTPTLIQKLSIPAILANKDVIGKAATGSGKTLAYSIPLLQNFYTNPENCDLRPEGLIISPTRELAHQIRDHIQAVCMPEYKHRIVSVTGGLAIQKQLRQLSKKPIVLIATPGRLMEVLELLPRETQGNYAKIPTLVLDEADRLIQSGNFKELEQVFNIIGVSKTRQCLVFSATFNTELWSSLNQKKYKLRRQKLEIKDIMHDKIGLNKLAEFVDADPESEVASEIRQAVIESPALEKDLYLYYFLSIYPGKTIVFVNSIDAVKRIVPLLKELRVPAIGVHSDMIQKQRLRSIERFKSIDDSCLIATDVAARGLDVPQVDHVVHYHLPRTADMYVHRSGRTARAGNQGVSVCLCSPQEKSGPLPNLIKLVKSKPANLDVDYDLLTQLKDRVSLAKQIADANQTSTKKGKTDSWLAKAAEDLGVEVEDELQPKSRKFKEKDVNVPQLREELQSLLDQKLGKSRKYLTSGSVNIAHELLSNKNMVNGKPTKSALDELKPKPKKRKM